MNAQDVKKYLSQDPERIVKALEFFGFHSFTIHQDRVSCALPDGDNATSVNIYYDSDFLNGIVFTRGSYKGDIYNIIEEFTNYTFKDIVINIKSIFGLSNNIRSRGNIPKKILDIGNYNYYLSLKKKKEKENIRNQTYDVDILDKYLPFPHEELIKEGISPVVAQQFFIHTDMERERILFPHFDWIEYDKIVGIQGRKIGIDNYAAKELGIPKYINYINGYKKEANLYGWAKNHERIIAKKELIIFEGEKSVLKESTFKKGEGNSVAVGNHSLSEAQIKFILKNTPDDTEIIIAFDKDVFANTTEKNSRQKLMKNIEGLVKMRDVSIMQRFSNLLDEKDAPVDKGFKIYNVLYSNRDLII